MAKLIKGLPCMFDLEHIVSYAFQPIVNVHTKEIFSYEALFRGKHKESLLQVMSEIPVELLAEFDQFTREIAIKMAKDLSIKCHLNLNFMTPCLQHSDKFLIATENAFKKNLLAMDQLIIEVLEGDIIHDPLMLIHNINIMKAKGCKIAIDDFGAGYSGLNLLAKLQPDFIKLDRALIQNITANGPKQTIIKAVILICDELGIDIIAEGVETLQEFDWLQNKGIELFQGYLFARPSFESLPTVVWP